MQLTARPGPLQGLWIFERPTFEDERGFFHEVHQARELEAVVGQPVVFKQVTTRARAGTCCAACTQRIGTSWCTPRAGRSSPRWQTFGPTHRRSVRVRRSASAMLIATLYVPRGLAHGYCVVSDEADYVYQVTAYYDGTDTRAVAWDDPDLAVPWPTRSPILSLRDQRNPTLRELFPDAIRSARRSRVASLLEDPVR